MTLPPSPCHLSLITHRGVEPLFPPWEGGVLTTWPMSLKLWLLVSPKYGTSFLKGYRLRRCTLYFSNYITTCYLCLYFLGRYSPRYFYYYNDTRFGSFIDYFSGQSPQQCPPTSPSLTINVLLFGTFVNPIFSNIFSILSSASI